MILPSLQVSRNPGNSENFSEVSVKPWIFNFISQRNSGNRGKIEDFAEVLAKPEKFDFKSQRNSGNFGNSGKFRISNSQERSENTSKVPGNPGNSEDFGEVLAKNYCDIFSKNFRWILWTLKCRQFFEFCVWLNKSFGWNIIQF